MTRRAERKALHKELRSCRLDERLLRQSHVEAMRSSWHREIKETNFRRELALIERDRAAALGRLQELS